MSCFQWAFPILAAMIIAPPAATQLVPPGQAPADGSPKSRLTAKDNGGVVSVQGDRFVVALPHRALFQWKPLPRDPAASEVAPQELEKLRKFESIQPPDPKVGAAQLQLSTFELPARKDVPIKLELIYTDLRDPSGAPKDGKLYMPVGDDLTLESNQPRPNMRYVVSLKRE